MLDILTVLYRALLPVALLILLVAAYGAAVHLVGRVCGGAEAQRAQEARGLPRPTHSEPDDEDAARYRVGDLQRWLENPVL